ncbi:TATA-binding protein-associated factor BTAF1, partial [Dictyocoela roeselum]
VTLPKSLLKNTFEILYRDKFSDFISDQSTAPVREAAAFLLKSIYPHLDTATQNQAVESTFAFLRSADWQVIVSGLLCTDQLIAFLTPAQKQQLSRTLAPLINAPDEDVRYWAAKILTRLSPQMDGPLAIEAARRCWNDIKNSDDISLSKTSVVLLLAEVYQQHKHLFKIRGKDDDLSIEKNLFLLFPCFRSPIRDVRKSILHLFISIFQNFKNGDKHGREVKNDKSYYKEDKKEVINGMNDCKDGYINNDIKNDKDGHINNDMNNDKDGHINDDMNNDKDGHINNDIKNDKDGHINNDMNNHINNDNNNVNTQHTCLPIPKIFSYLIQNLFVEEKEDILELTKRLLTLTYPHLKNKKENIRRYIKILTKNLNDEYTKSEFEDSTLETDLHFSNSGIKALGEEVIMRGRVMFLEFLTDVAEGSDIEIHDIEFEAVKRITESYFLELCKSIKNLKSNKN